MNLIFPCDHFHFLFQEDNCKVHNDNVYTLTSFNCTFTDLIIELPLNDDLKSNYNYYLSQFEAGI